LVVVVFALHDHRHRVHFDAGDLSLVRAIFSHNRQGGERQESAQETDEHVLSHEPYLLRLGEFKIRASARSRMNGEDPEETREESSAETAPELEKLPPESQFRDARRLAHTGLLRQTRRTSSARVVSTIPGAGPQTALEQPEGHENGAVTAQRLLPTVHERHHAPLVQF
jgi:hypothetical protein